MIWKMPTLSQKKKLERLKNNSKLLRLLLKKRLKKLPKKRPRKRRAKSQKNLEPV